MKRCRAILAAAFLVAAAAHPGVAQERADARVELALYTGGSYTSGWFTTPGAEGGRAAWRPGYAPGFGATAQLWAEPRVGVRLHAAYLPQNLPGAGGLELRSRVVNSYLYDLDLVLRPFVLSTPNTLLQTVYLFAGGGGYTADVADSMAPGADGGECIAHASWTAGEVCVDTGPGHATTGMGVAGGGISLARVGPGVEAFGEAAVHVYDSPAHARPGASGADRLTFTPRAVIGLKLALGGWRAAERVSAPVTRAAPAPPAQPLPTPAEPAPAQPLPQSAQPAPARGTATETTRICVVRDGALARVQIAVDPVTADTPVGGEPAGRVGAESAGGQGWFVRGEPVVFAGRRFVKFGGTRVLDVGDVVRAGEFRGVPVFAAPAVRTDVIYLPVGPGCEFQPYAAELKAGRIRG